MKIFLSPFSRLLTNGKPNAKNYPYFPELIDMLEKNHRIFQVGRSPEPVMAKEKIFDFSMAELLKKIKKDMDIFISVDNFFPHLCHYYGKKGVVIWGFSDPKIFGYPENNNILKDRKYLRKNQFELWEQFDYSPEAYLQPTQVIKLLKLQSYKNT